MIGTTVAGYEITEFLAEGGMGAVWGANHSVMGRAAVVKLLHAELGNDPTIVQRFFNEARAAASINDPGIVQVFDVGRLPDGRPYLVMERLTGHTLADRISERAKQPPTRARTIEAVNILRLIVRTLVAAHARGIVHRDLKPHNIFLVSDPDVEGGERTKILDFGIAKLATDQSGHTTRAGSLFGTPAYMAPEQCSDAASVDARADLYAVGCIAYEMFTGAPPFGSGGLEIVAAQIRDEPVPLRVRDPAVPAALDTIVDRLLRKQPSERYSSTDELHAALADIDLDPEALATPLAFTVPPTSPPTAAARPVPTTHAAASGAAIAGVSARAKKTGYLIGGLIALVAAAAVVIATTRRGPDQAEPEHDQTIGKADPPPAVTPPRSAPDPAPPPATTPVTPLDEPPTIAKPEPVPERRLAPKPQAPVTTPKPPERLSPDPTPRLPPEPQPPPITPAPTTPEPIPPQAPPPQSPPVTRKPTVRAVEAGPIWNNADAEKKCPPLCPAPARWTKAWRTTIRGKMSVCDCETP